MLTEFFLTLLVSFQLNISFTNNSSDFVKITPCDVKIPFVIRQNGNIICPRANHYVLAKKPFEIIYLGDEYPALYASRSHEVINQVYAGNWFIGFDGFQTAVGQYQFYLWKEKLELYDGWTPSFQKNWGGLYEERHDTAYENIKDHYDKTFLLNMSGKDMYHFNYKAGYLTLKITSFFDGASEKEIKITENTINKFYLVLFEQDGKYPDKTIYIMKPYLAILHFKE